MVKEYQNCVQFNLGFAVLPIRSPNCSSLFPVLNMDSLRKKMATLKIIKMEEAHHSHIKECFHLKYDITYSKIDIAVGAVKPV